MHPQTEYEIVEQLLPMLQDQMINQVVAQFIPENNLVVLYKGPEKEGLVTPTVEDFSKAIAEVESSDIKANAVEAIDSDFLDESKLKGSAVKSISTAAPY